MKGWTKLEIAKKMIKLLKSENEKMASLLKDYTPSPDDLKEMEFLTELFDNQFINEE